MWVAPARYSPQSYPAILALRPVFFSGRGAGSADSRRFSSVNVLGPSARSMGLGALDAVVEAADAFLGVDDAEAHRAFERRGGAQGACQQQGGEEAGGHARAASASRL